MVAFLTGQTLTFSQPNVQVDAVSAPGTYRFELIVVTTGTLRAHRPAFSCAWRIAVYQRPIRHKAS